MNHRIAIISDHASPLGALGGVDGGGQNVYVAQLARQLAKAGYGADVFTRRDSPGLARTVEFAPGARVIHLDAGPARHIAKEELLPYMPRFTEALLEFTRGEGIRYSLVHANFFLSGLTACELKRELGVPFVITFHALGRVRRLHQQAADRFPDERFAIEERIVAEAARIIAECPQEREELIRLYHADPAKITIIPCGFDPAEMEPIDRLRARRKLGFYGEEHLILQLGRLVPRKGVDTVVAGLAELVNERGIPARLIIVGGESAEPDPAATPEIGRLQALAEELGVAGHITFAGRKSRDILKYYYSAADVFVTTPWYEPFGITPLEAMACGTPVIGSRVGGIKSTVLDGHTGFLVPPRDPGALAARLATLLTDRSLARDMRDRGLRRVNEHFTWERVAERVAGLYEEVLCTDHTGSERGGSDAITRCFDEAMEVLRASRERLGPAIADAARIMAESFERGGKLLICGNGGSAADSQHFATELVGRFKRAEQPPLPALALTADTALLTAWSNDCGFESVFARQVEAFAQPHDVLVAISTSGESKNVLRALEVGRARGLRTIALTGGEGGRAAAAADTAIVVPSCDTQHIQEVHILVIHLLCDLVVERHRASLRCGLATPTRAAMGHNGRRTVRPARAAR